MRENWPHAPPHYFTAHGTYIITAATLHRRPLFNSGTKLDFLCDTTFELAKDYELTLQAWAFFANHYHLVISFHNTATAHRDFVRHLHRAIWRYSSTAWMLLLAGESRRNFEILA